MLHALFLVYSLSLANYLLVIALERTFGFPAGDERSARTGV